MNLNAHKILIVGDGRPNHVGAHFLAAARSMGLDNLFLDTAPLDRESPWLQKKIHWWLLGRKPIHLFEFSRKVLKAAESYGPHWILTVGFAPLDRAAVERLEKQNVCLINFLTDNPWAIVPRPFWFLRTLRHYAHVFTPRRSNESMLSRTGCRRVSYLPFAYAPESHYPEEPGVLEEEKKFFESDIVFVGCADRDRLVYIRALLRAGFRVNLYGPRWERYARTARMARGNADPRTMRLAVGKARLALGLVRRANRDGNSMRTFEIPAIGGCMLAEDTEDHRVLFGAEGENVVYFRGSEDLVGSVARLVNDEKERLRLARAARRLITSGNHTYRHRLEAMLQAVPV